MVGEIFSPLLFKKNILSTDSGYAPKALPFTQIHVIGKLKLL